MDDRLNGTQGPQRANFSSPIFDPVRPALTRLAQEPGWPDAPRLDLLARELGVEPRTASGMPVRFAHPRPDNVNYELRVHSNGEVSTRPRNWHDLFNALAWIAFPRTKAALNARHAERIPKDGGRRGSLRDLLTIFDEGGVIVACAEEELAALVRGFRWRELFWERRSKLRETLRLAVVGHAVLEQALRPWPGITCKALFVAVDVNRLGLPLEQLLALLDERAAAWFAAASDTLTPRALAPLPIFGYPGWFPGNEREDFYADTRYFRPLRRAPLGVQSRRESARQSLRARAEESPGSVERDAG